MTGQTDGGSFVRVSSCALQVNTAGLSAAGTLLVSGCKDGTVTVWDTCSFSTLQQVHCHSGTVHRAAFSPGTALSAHVLCESRPWWTLLLM